MNFENAAAELERMGFVVHVEEKERRRPVSETQFLGSGAKTKVSLEPVKTTRLRVKWDRKVEAHESSEWIEARLRRVVQLMGGHVAKIDVRRRQAVILT